MTHGVLICIDFQQKWQCSSEWSGTLSLQKLTEIKKLGTSCLIFNGYNKKFYLASTNIPSSTGISTLLSTSTVPMPSYCLCFGCDRWVIIIIDASNGMTTDAFNVSKLF
jgi:hypothetical protein